MCNIHAMEIIPNQSSINSIALYRDEFDNKELDYKKLLQDIKVTIEQKSFMKEHDTSGWMQMRGVDYLSNPKLFHHAPLTHLCVFLGELFNSYELQELQDKLSPEILECALTRLGQFKS